MKWPWQHQHQQNIVDVQHSEMVHPGMAPLLALSGGAMPKNEMTTVLWRCPCGEVGTWTLIGTWTKEQIQGQSAEAATKAAIDRFIDQTKG